MAVIRVQAAETMRFFEPILNSPYEEPHAHWELDEDGLPTDRTIPSRRSSALLTPIPNSKHQKGRAAQTRMVLDTGHGFAWQAINAARSQGSKNFSRPFSSSPLASPSGTGCGC